MKKNAYRTLYSRGCLNTVNINLCLSGFFGTPDPEVVCLLTRPTGHLFPYSIEGGPIKPRRLPDQGVNGRLPRYGHSPTVCFLAWVAV